MIGSRETITTGAGKTGAALSREEVEAFAVDWYRKLDRHAPSEELTAMVAEDVDLQLPEGPVIGVAAFREWYEGVVRIFFDEIHVVERTTVSWKDQRALVKVLVNWQARRWSPPAARSQWIGFEADQDWEMIRSPVSGRPIIARYVVNALSPMPGSPPL